MTKLSVNLNKFALLRNSRGIGAPDVLGMARRCAACGAHGITVHPRPDQRHTKYSDVYEISELLLGNSEVEFNVEGNPIPKFIEIVKETKPDQCTLVPDSPDQLTSDHGWNLTKDGKALKPIIQKLRSLGIRISLFMDTDLRQIDLAKEVGADRIELYTEPFAKSFGKSYIQETLSHYKDAAAHAQQQGLGVNAGHDLNLNNLGLLLETIPGILEVSIGHALVIESLDYTLEGVISKYLEILAAVEKGK